MSKMIINRVNSFSKDDTVFGNIEKGQVFVNSDLSGLYIKFDNERQALSLLTYKLIYFEYYSKVVPVRTKLNVVSNLNLIDVDKEK